MITKPILNLLLVAIICGLPVQSVSRERELEALLFKPNKFFEPEETLANIQELHEIYSTSKRTRIYSDLISKLVELSDMKSCDDDSFVKFDLLQSQYYNTNLESFINDRRDKFSEKCERENSNKLSEIVINLDKEIRETVDKLGQSVRNVPSPFKGKTVFLNSLFEAHVVKGLYEYLRQSNTKIRDNQLVTEEEFHSILNSSIVVPCESLSLDFNQIMRYYIRNYLEKGRLSICTDHTNRWIMNFKVCDAIVADHFGKIASFIYEIISNQRERFITGKTQLSLTSWNMF